MPILVAPRLHASRCYIRKYRLCNIPSCEIVIYHRICLIKTRFSCDWLFERPIAQRVYLRWCLSGPMNDLRSRDSSWSPTWYLGFEDVIVSKSSSICGSCTSLGMIKLLTPCKSTTIRFWLFFSWPNMLENCSKMSSSVQSPQISPFAVFVGPSLLYLTH